MIIATGNAGSADLDAPRSCFHSRFIKLGCSLLALLAWAAPVSAQVVNDEGLWLSLYAQGDFQAEPLKERNLLWWFDGQARFLDDADGFTQGVVRPGIGKAVGDNAAIWAGYAYVKTLPVFGLNFDENRVWQQITWSKSNDPCTIALRSRLEQRFLNTGSDAGWRYRQFVRGQRQFARFPHFTFVCWDEVFFNLNDTDWGASAGFDQNRIFVGFGYKSDPDSRWTMEIGYLNQSILLRNQRDDLSNHILSINLFRSR